MRPGHLMTLDCLLTRKGTQVLDKPYSTLLFDIDGTLLDYGTAQKRAAATALAGLGAEGPPGPLLDRVMRLVEGEEVQDIESCRPGRREPGSPWMQSVFDSAGVALPSGAFLETYFEAMAGHGVPLPGIRDMLVSLAPGRVMGAVTNGLGPVQRSRLALSGLMGYLQVLVISCEVGLAKPDPEMLRLAMRLAGSTPGDTLFIGDSPTSDMGAAMAACVDFVYIDPEGVFPASGPRVLELRSARDLAGQLRPVEVDRNDVST
jgi:2-haloacid dehalogenase